MTATIIFYIIMGIGAGFCVAGAVGAAILGRSFNESPKDNHKQPEEGMTASFGSVKTMVLDAAKEKGIFVEPQPSKADLERARIAYEQAAKQHKISHEQVVLQAEQAMQHYIEALDRLEWKEVNLSPPVVVNPENEETPTVRASKATGSTATYQSIARYVARREANKPIRDIAPA